MQEANGQRGNSFLSFRQMTLRRKSPAVVGRGKSRGPEAEATAGPRPGCSGRADEAPEGTAGPPTAKRGRELVPNEPRAPRFRARKRSDCGTFFPIRCFHCIDAVPGATMLTRLFAATTASAASVCFATLIPKNAFWTADRPHLAPQPALRVRTGGGRFQ
jgi:hypothetical protein